jgi:hypothetical protein
MGRLGVEWCKSSYSINNDCVEARAAGAYVYVRDSKDPAHRSLRCSRSAWLDLITRIRLAQPQVSSDGIP